MASIDVIGSFEGLWGLILSRGWALIMNADFGSGADIFAGAVENFRTVGFLPEALASIVVYGYVLSLPFVCVFARVRAEFAGDSRTGR